MGRIVVFLLFVVTLPACSWVDKGEVDVYHLADMRPLQQQQQWSFEGRLALSDGKESFSASLNWQHRSESDAIELIGPLAQGRLLISVTGDVVVVDDGDRKQEFVGDVSAILAEQLGVEMPVDALRYWVLGVSEPNSRYLQQGEGFVQQGWLIQFAEMQRVNSVSLPRKMTAQKDKARIKLIVDKWDLS